MFRSIKPWVVRLYAGAFAFFLAIKLVVRPLTRGTELPGWAEVVIYSSPNAVEAVIGMTTVAVLLLIVRQRYGAKWAWFGDRPLYALTAILAGTYVLTQEFELHHLGGRNVYDPFDAAASALGVVGMWVLFDRFGVVREGARLG